MTQRLRALSKVVILAFVALSTALVFAACSSSQPSHDFTLLSFENGSTADGLAENERTTDKFYQTWFGESSLEPENAFAKTLYSFDATIAKDPDIEEVAITSNDPNVGLYVVEGMRIEDDQLLDEPIQQEVVLSKKQATDPNQIAIRVDLTSEDLARDLYVSKLADDVLTIAAKYTDGAVAEKTYSFRPIQDNKGNDLFVITETLVEN